MKPRDLIWIAVAAAVGVLAERLVTNLLQRGKGLSGGLPLDANLIPPPKAL